MFEPNSFRNLLIFILIVGGLIFLHELGHFLSAIWLGVKVKEFGIGFPPRLFGTARNKEGKRRWFFGAAPADLDPNSVIYSLNWLPIGGFMRPAGEDDPTVPDGLSASPKLTRFIVLAAGPAMNLLVGVIVFTVAYVTGWPQYTDQVRIAGVVAGAPADTSGLKIGDVILSANGEDITFSSGRLTEITHANLGQPVELNVVRNGQSLSISVVPRTEWPAGQGPMGIALDQGWVLSTQPLPQALFSGISQVGFQIRETFMMPVRLISREIQASDVRFVSIVGMAQINDAVVENAVEVQSLFPILQFTGLITVALALTNLLPLPALDGGRILFVLIEAIRGRRVDPLREGYVHIFGMLALLALMVFMVINDLINPVITR
jgi:regulator of sigma E protease